MVSILGKKKPTGIRSPLILTSFPGHPSNRYVRDIYHHLESGSMGTDLKITAPYPNRHRTWEWRSPSILSPLYTLPETNSQFAPENGWLEYFLVSFWGPVYFQGRAVGFRECICISFSSFDCNSRNAPTILPNHPSLT